MKRLFLFLLLFQALPAEATEARTKYSLEIEDQASGCFHRYSTKASFHIDGNRLIPKSGNFSIKDAEKVKAFALASVGKFEHLTAAELGITSQLLKEKRNDAIRAAMRFPGAEKLDASKIVLTEDDLTYALSFAEKLGRGGTERAMVNLKFGGDQPITISSDRGIPGMLPWRVSVGNKHSNVYSTELSQAVAKLLRDSSPNAKRLRANQYWRTDFWNESLIWGKTFLRGQ